LDPANERAKGDRDAGKAFCQRIHATLEWALLIADGAGERADVADFRFAAGGNHHGPAASADDHRRLVDHRATLGYRGVVGRETIGEFGNRERLTSESGFV